MVLPVCIVSPAQCQFYPPVNDRCNAVIDQDILLYGCSLQFTSVMNYLSISFHKYIKWYFWRIESHFLNVQNVQTCSVRLFCLCMSDERKSGNVKFVRETAHGKGNPAKVTLTLWSFHFTSTLVKRLDVNMLTGGRVILTTCTMHARLSCLSDCA